MRGPLLEISTLIDQDATVRIDGKTYPLRHPRQMGLVDFSRISKICGTVYELQPRLEALNDDDVQALAHALRQGCELVIDAPPDVHALINDWERLEILHCFSSLRQGPTAALAEAMAAASPTGESKSQG